MAPYEQPFWNRIRLPFLKTLLEDLLLDSCITEVMVNDGGSHVFVERDGALEPVADRQLETPY